MLKKSLQFLAVLTMLFPVASMAQAQGHGGPLFDSDDSSGYGGNKVTLCFNGRTLTVGAPAAQSFFRRGATPGACVPGQQLPGSISGTTYIDPKGHGNPHQFQKFMNRHGSVTVYLDTNNNGALDSGEQSLLSDVMGNYTFNSLPSGVTYNIREVVPVGLTETYPPDMAYHELLHSGENITFDDFANATRLAVTHGRPSHFFNFDFDSE